MSVWFPGSSGGLALVNTNACGTKANENCKGSSMAAVLLVSSVVKSAVLVCRAGHCEPVSPTVWLLLVALLFFLVPGCVYSFYMSQLFVGLGEGKPKQDLHVVLPEAREARCSPSFSFPGKGNSY